MAVFCDGCDSRMQSQTLVRFARVRGRTTALSMSAWYCWTCRADRHVPEPRPRLACTVEPRGWITRGQAAVSA